VQPKTFIFVLQYRDMKKFILALTIGAVLTIVSSDLQAQCSICTKTAQQLGEKPAKALNGGIIYLAAMPLAIFGFIAYRWMKQNEE
jgi:undecaprenyl pyrophosphate phosphatase UppP